MIVSPYPLNQIRPLVGRSPGLSRDQRQASVAKLTRLRAAIHHDYDALRLALVLDQPHRRESEIELCEIIVTLQKINLTLITLQSTSTTSDTQVHHDPCEAEQRVKLITADNHMPFKSLFMPLVDVLACGRNAILSPSEHAPHTARMISTLIAEHYAVNEVMCLAHAASDQRLTASTATALLQTRITP